MLNFINFLNINFQYKHFRKIIIFKDTYLTYLTIICRNTVLIHLSGRSLIWTVSVEKKMQIKFNIKHKQVIKFREFSAKKVKKL